MVQTIIKAHGGELNVETKEGEGAEFIIEVDFQMKRSIEIVN